MKYIIIKTRQIFVLFFKHYRNFYFFSNSSKNNFIEEDKRYYSNNAFFVARIYILCYKFLVEKKKYRFDVFDVILIVIALTIVGFVIYNNFINVGYEIKYQGFIEQNQICLYFKNKGQETVIRPTDFALEINNSNIRYVPQKIEYKVDYSILDTITITEDMFIVGENEQKIFYITFDNELFSNVHNISIFFKGKQIK